MNNDPASVAAALRSLVVYAVCAVIAIIIGVLMTNPMTYSTMGFMAVLCVVLVIPILIKWHRPLMIACWCTPIVAFFIKGSPTLPLVMIALSLTASCVERAMGQKRFISVPQITWPLVFLIGVVAITAKLTGGIGLRAFGSDVYGGKKYVFLIVAILGYFAVSARPIPVEQARKYVILYFAGSLLCVVQDFFPVTPGFLHPIYWLIPPAAYSFNGPFQLGVTRLSGTGFAAVSAVNIMLIRYRLRGIFLSGKMWRPVAFFIFCILIFMGGFRSAIIGTAITLTLLFFVEGLHRTRLLPFVIIFALAGAAGMFALGSKLPYTFQRALCFLPESVVHLSSDARASADASWQWRVDMWKALLPQIPKHLVVGKGYAISVEDFQTEMGAGAAVRSIDPAQQALALSSDYHNGPLSVILPFGIWGAIGMVWFLLAGLWIMHRNYRYSIPELQGVNTFLFVAFIVTTISFYGGSMANSMGGFTGLLGLSVAINRGVCRVPIRVRQTVPFIKRPPREGLQPGPLPPRFGPGRLA
ncbi:MAG TPA: O-antigen ligase family protein [Candidatus Sulfotelmatobacter sp.]|nr:O-antigen ligase family protein [Candidatus Sulfotelmatobacter sp.]